MDDFILSIYPPASCPLVRWMVVGYITVESRLASAIPLPSELEKRLIAWCGNHPSANVSCMVHSFAGCELMADAGPLAQGIVVITLNKPTNEHTPLEAQEMGAKVAEHLRSTERKSLAFALPLASEAAVACAFGYALRDWQFTRHKTTPLPCTQQSSKALYTITEDAPAAQTYLPRYQALYAGIHLCRTLVSEPSNILTPFAWIEYLQPLKDAGIIMEVLDKAQLETLGMNALLEVAKGSAQAPYVITLRWCPPSLEATPPLALVGKGVCFDAGGISLKPPIDMHYMRHDMAGAAAVVGTIYTAALQKLPVHAVGVIGLVENMPDGNALCPGNVITTMAGKTVEVVDTDAEGRLVLSDCLWYCLTHFNPSIMIDLATLTGDTVTTLGSHYAGLFCDHPFLRESLLEAAKQTNEGLWPLPLGEPYRKQLSSPIADMKNIGISGEGENVAAAEFLRYFTGGIPWAHLDIAGVAWATEDTLYTPKDAITGYGVRLLECWLQNPYHPKSQD